MINRDLAVLPYQFARTPLVIFDLKVMHRLAADSPGRVAFDRGLGTLDVLVGRLANNTNLVEQGSERIGRAGRTDRPDAQPDTEPQTESRTEEPAEPDRTTDAEQPPAVQPAARKARARATKAKQHTSARGNRSLTSIRQGLAQTEAVAEAREHQAEQRAEQQADEAGSDGSA
jgi:hypothetical protein